MLFGSRRVGSRLGSDRCRIGVPRLVGLVIRRCLIVLLLPNRAAAGFRTHQRRGGVAGGGETGAAPLGGGGDETDWACAAAAMPANKPRLTAGRFQQARHGGNFFNLGIHSYLGCASLA